jgi:hypothetical protein
MPSKTCGSSLPPERQTLTSPRDVDQAIPAEAKAKYRTRTRADRDQLRLASDIAPTIAAKRASFVMCKKSA